MDAERPCLILSPRFSDDSRIMRSAALGLGWRVVRLQGWRADTGAPYPTTAPITAYGEALFVEAVAEQLSLALERPALDWLARLPADYRRREVRFTRLAEARACAHRRFFKPADEKCFEARVYASGAELPAYDSLDEDTPVLIAEEVAWTLEVRCFVHDGRVRAHSVYARDGALAQAADGSWPLATGERERALEFADRLLADIADVPRAVVLDVGLIRERGWAAVELNPAWGSGLYGCDASAALSVVAASCGRPERAPTDATERRSS